MNGYTVLAPRLWDSDVPPATAFVHAVLPGETAPVCGLTGETTTNAVRVSCWRCRGVLQNGGAA